MIFSAQNISPDSEKEIESIFDVEDAVLVRRVQAGRREAFDEIVRRYRGKICRFLARQTSGPEHAEDIAQQTFLKAFLSLDTLREQDKLAGWLYRIAFRLAVDDSRKTTPELLNITKTSELVDPKTVEFIGPMAETEDADNLWTLAQRVLTTDEYSVVWLKYVDGYKVDSIATILGKTQISVRVLLFRARKKLLPVLKGRSYR